MSIRDFVGLTKCFHYFYSLSIPATVIFIINAMFTNQWNLVLPSFQCYAAIGFFSGCAWAFAGALDAHVDDSDGIRKCQVLLGAWTGGVTLLGLYPVLLYQYGKLSFQDFLATLMFSFMAAWSYGYHFSAIIPLYRIPYKKQWMPCITVLMIVAEAFLICLYTSLKYGIPSRVSGYCLYVIFFCPLLSDCWMAYAGRFEVGPPRTILPPPTPKEPEVVVEEIPVLWN